MALETGACEYDLFPAALAAERVNAGDTLVKTSEKCEAGGVASEPTPKFPPLMGLVAGGTAFEIGAIPVMDGLPAIAGIANAAPKSAFVVQGK